MKLIIRLEARLQPNIGNYTLRPVLTVCTCSGITPPKVNRFERNLEHSVYILGGWPGVFWAPSVQWGQLESQAKFCFFLSGKGQIPLRYPVAYQDTDQLAPSLLT